MASATCSVGASRTWSQSGNLALSWANARPELRSEVCWDSTVATSSSMTGNRGLGTNGPWLARSRGRPAAISDGSGTVPAFSDEADEGVAQLALATGAVLAVGGVHVDGDDPGAAAGGRHEGDGPAGERDLGAVRRPGRGIDADEGGPGSGHLAGVVRGDVDRDDVVDLGAPAGLRRSGGLQVVPEPPGAGQELVEFEQDAEVEGMELDDVTAHGLGLNRD